MIELDRLMCRKRKAAMVGEAGTSSPAQYNHQLYQWRSDENSPAMVLRWRAGYADKIFSKLSTVLFNAGCRD